MNDSHISTFLTTLFSNFNASRLRYCVLRQYFDLPDALTGSDLDILVDPKTFVKSRDLLLTSARESGFELLRETSYGEVHFFHFYKMLADDYVFVRVDLNRDQRYFGACLLSAEEILKKSIEYRDIRVAHPVHEATLSLILPLVASGNIKEKHIARIYEVFKKYPTEFAAELDLRLGQNFAKQILTELNNGNIRNLSGFRGTLISRILCKSWIKSPLNSLKHLLIFIKDILYLRIHPPGCVIVLWHKDEKELKRLSEIVYKNTLNIFLGEHRYIYNYGTYAMQLVNNNSFMSVVRVLLYSLAEYYLDFRKSVRRHGIITLVSELSAIIPSMETKHLSRIMPRYLFINMIANRCERRDLHTGINVSGKVCEHEELTDCISKILDKLTNTR